MYRIIRSRLHASPASGGGCVGIEGAARRRCKDREGELKREGTAVRWTAAIRCRLEEEKALSRRSCLESATSSDTLLVECLRCCRGGLGRGGAGGGCEDYRFLGRSGAAVTAAHETNWWVLNCFPKRISGGLFFCTHRGRRKHGVKEKRHIPCKYVRVRRARRKHGR